MEKRIRQVGGDYIVEAKYMLPNGIGYYRPLRNFGKRYADADAFLKEDLVNVSKYRINFLMRNYREGVRYKRLVGKDGKLFYVKDEFKKL